MLGDNFAFYYNREIFWCRNLNVDVSCHITDVFIQCLKLFIYFNVEISGNTYSASKKKVVMIKVHIIKSNVLEMESSVIGNEWVNDETYLRSLLLSFCVQDNKYVS